jgi:hypothetical protein
MTDYSNIFQGGDSSSDQSAVTTAPAQATTSAPATTTQPATKTVTPYGMQYPRSPDEARAMFQAHYQPNLSAATSTGDMASGMVNAASRGATFDLADKFAAAMDAEFGNLQTWTGQETIPGATWSDRYQNRLQHYRQASDDFAAKHPLAAHLAWGAGALGTGIGINPSTLLGQIGTGALAGGAEGFAQAPDTSLMGDLKSTGIGAVTGGIAGPVIARGLPALANLPMTLYRGGLTREGALAAADAAAKAGTPIVVPKASSLAMPFAKTVAVPAALEAAKHLIPGGEAVGPLAEVLASGWGVGEGVHDLLPAVSKYLRGNAIARAAQTLANQRPIQGAGGRMIVNPLKRLLPVPFGTPPGTGPVVSESAANVLTGNLPSNQQQQPVGPVAPYSTIFQGASQ